MRYKPERALTRNDVSLLPSQYKRVEMRYKPERALTLFQEDDKLEVRRYVEMRYKPERALTHPAFLIDVYSVFM